ncbi:MAG: lipocalin-like domain-containing protein [Acidobacteriota bacterium]|nr:MAG: lipocalin-like domain-containing protein [Acidobacteriota bacterium]
MLTILAIVGLSCSPPVTESAPTEDTGSAPANPLQGVWHIESVERVGPEGDRTPSPTYGSLVIFTEGYYSFANTYGETPRLPFEGSGDGTVEEKVAAFDTITVNTGTYEVDGSSLTTHPMAARYQSYAGGRGEYEWNVEGNTLQLTLKQEFLADGVASFGTDGSEWNFTLTRLE